MLDKTVEAKSKAALQSPTSIREIVACCWKSQGPDKEEKTFKPSKEEKAKLADSQPTILSGIVTQSSG